MRGDSRDAIFSSQTSSIQCEQTGAYELLAGYMLTLCVSNSPETLGLPASCIYLLALFLFIPFRYYVGSNDIVGSSERTTNDGGWFGDLGGRSGFPHHEVRSSSAR